MFDLISVSYPVTHTLAEAFSGDTLKLEIISLKESCVLATTPHHVGPYILQGYPHIDMELNTSQTPLNIGPKGADSSIPFLTPSHHPITALPSLTSTTRTLQQPLNAFGSLISASNTG